MASEDPTAAVRAQFGRQAAHYTSSPIHAQGPDLQRLRDLLALQGPEIVLDVATGTGHTAMALAPHVTEVTALDPTPEMLQEAAQLAAQRGITNVHFVAGVAEALPFADAAFDVVTVRRAPHHFQSIPQALREMHRVLKPGGALAVIDQISPDHPGGAALQEQMERRRDPSHVRALNAAEWRDAIEDAGFTIRHLEIAGDRSTFDTYFGTAGVSPEARDAIIAALRAGDPEARAAMQFDDDPPPHGSFFRPYILVVASLPV
jgi:ubiquinone/menaquinone biosynthesis C-methylase UbiE